MSSVIPSENTRIVVLLIAISSTVPTYWGQNVYHNSAVSNFGTTFFVNLSITSITQLYTNGTNAEASFNILTGVSLPQFAGIILSIAKRSKILRTLFVSKYRRQSSEDMELFEMAAADREIESECDEESNIESLNSLSTYRLLLKDNCHAYKLYPDSCTHLRMVRTSFVSFVV